MRQQGGGGERERWITKRRTEGNMPGDQRGDDGDRKQSLEGVNEMSDNHNAPGKETISLPAGKFLPSTSKASWGEKMMPN